MYLFWTMIINSSLRLFLYMVSHRHLPLCTFDHFIGFRTNRQSDKLVNKLAANEFVDYFDATQCVNVGLKGQTTFQTT